MPSEGTLFMAQDDVRYFVYRLGVERRLGEHASLDPMTLSGIRPSAILREAPEIQEILRNEVADHIFPYVCVLPMGLLMGLPHGAPSSPLCRRCLPAEGANH